MSVTYTCFRCGKSKTVALSTYNKGDKKRHFCSRVCNLQQLNEELNPTRMTKETRHKLSIARSTTGNGKTYRKLNGKHYHRTVAEIKLGRKLKPGEIVHHLDRNKRNNDPDNIMVFINQSEHVKWHAQHDEHFGRNKSVVMPNV